MERNYTYWENRLFGRIYQNCQRDEEIMKDMEELEEIYNELGLEVKEEIVKKHAISNYHKAQQYFQK